MGQPDEISLQAGALTPIRLTVTGLTSTFAATWETLGTGWQPIPADNLFSAILIGYLRTTLLRFLKTTALAGDLTLTAAEMAYLATATGLNVGGQDWLAALPVDAPAPPASFPEVTKVLDGLLTYAAVKASYSPLSSKAPQLLTTLQDMTGPGHHRDRRPARTHRLGRASLEALLPRLFNVTTLAALPDPLPNLARLKAAFAIVTASHSPQPPSSPPPPTTPPPTVVSDFQAAVRSRYAESDWLTIVKPVNDATREMRRDALVAYILLTVRQRHPPPAGRAGNGQQDRHRRGPVQLLPDGRRDAAVHGDLADPSRPVVGSAVHRTLPAQPRASRQPGRHRGTSPPPQWAWRKRFRVWQANREVFLWPENWLEPTLRDDQSPFFKTTMSHLLQSDITDDTAAGAYLDYLTSLEQVAKLEPCGLYYQPADARHSRRSRHVIARTAGAHRKYYYRRFQDGAGPRGRRSSSTSRTIPSCRTCGTAGSCCSGCRSTTNHVTDPSNPGPNLPHAGDQTLASWNPRRARRFGRPGRKSQTQEQVSAILCFSEYYNGKWQPAKTSDAAIRSASASSPQAPSSAPQWFCGRGLPSTPATRRCMSR